MSIYSEKFSDSVFQCMARRLFRYKKNQVTCRNESYFGEFFLSLDSSRKRNRGRSTPHGIGCNNRHRNVPKLSNLCRQTFLLARRSYSINSEFFSNEINGRNLSQEFRLKQPRYPKYSLWIQRNVKSIHATRQFCYADNIRGVIEPACRRQRKPGFHRVSENALSPRSIPIDSL